MLSTGSPFAIVANLNKWNKLSPEQRAIVERNWAAELQRNRVEAHQQQLDAWTFFTNKPKLKTYLVSDEEQKKEWTPIVYPYQMKKMISLLGKEKTDQIIKAINSEK
jgi:TRAP-type C4-dicarboxylate transport system substrate-binding protein